MITHREHVMGEVRVVRWLISLVARNEHTAFLDNRF